MNDIVRALLTNPDTTVDDIFCLLSNYNNLDETQRDTFFDLRYNSKAFMQLMTNHAYLLRLLEPETIHEDIVYLIGEHVDIEQFSVYQSVKLLNKLFSHEDALDLCTANRIILTLIECFNDWEEDFYLREVQQIIVWFKKYAEEAKESMANFMAWLIEIHKCTPEQVKAFCEDELMPSYEQVNAFLNM